MATTVGQHSVAAFTSPVNGTTPIDANTVRGNDNTVRVAYVDHDADPGIHVQSSTLASRPVAGTAGRKWITEDSGVYTLWFDDGTNWHPVSSEAVALSVLATETLAKGDVVKVTGWNNGQDLPEVAKTTSASDTAFAVITAAVASGAMGYATNTGVLQDINTNAYNVGDILYANGSGGFTATKPTSGNYQPCAYVLRKNNVNGVIYVEFSTPRIVERSDNTASTIVLRDASGNFSAGTITAGAVTSTGLVTFASLKGTGATTVTNILDEDNMASDSATALATQQSIKAYVDTKVATVDTLAEVLANGNTTGANDIIVSTGQKIRTPAIAAGDGTASATIANSTGVMTIASSVLTTTDINGGTIDGTTIGGSSAAAGTFTTVGATTGNITTVNATTVDATNVEVTNVKAKDGTASITIADSTGALTLSSALADSNLATISTAGKVANSATTATSANTNSAIVARDSSGNFSAGTITANLTGNISGTAPAGTLTGTTLASNVVSSSLTSVGTLTSLTVSGGATFASTSGNFGIGTTSPVDTDGFGKALDVRSATGGQLIIRDSDDTTRYGRFAYDGTDNSTWVEATGTGSLIRFRTAGTQKMSLDASGNLAVDTNTLYVDATNNRVGIGTASPAYALDVVGTAATALRIRGSSASTNNTAMRFFGVNANADMWAIGNAVSTNDTTRIFEIYDLVASESRVRLDASGNLGLGVTPSAWGSGFAVTQYKGGFVGSQSGSYLYSAQNAYYDTTDSRWERVATGEITLYEQSFGKHIWYNAASGAANSAITFTQAMTLDASGNLGVGTTSPQSTIDAYRSTNGAYFRGGSGDPGRQLKFSSSTTTNAGDTHTIDAQSGTGILAFAVTSTERARITSGGWFKASNDGTYRGSTGSYNEINNTQGGNPILSLRGSSAIDPNGLDIQFNAVSNDNNTQYFLTCLDSTTTRCYIWSDGDLANHDGVYGTISDERLKQDIVDAGSQWDDIKAIRFRKYRMKTDVAADPNAPAMLGVVAQELEQISPGLVDEHPEYETRDVPVLDEDGNETGEVTTEKVQVGTTKTVKSSILLMKAAVALQEAMARIEALEARLEALEA